MPVYFVREENRGVAYFRANDQAEDVFLAAIALVTYDSNSDVRDHFAGLVAAAADYYRRTYAAEVVAPASRLAGLPCETCTAPEADDIRFRAGQSSGAFELSPGGFPAGCCKRRIVGVVSSGLDAPRSAARR
jgi:hypothetical protein